MFRYLLTLQCSSWCRLYGGAIPSALNVISSMGFLILNGIIGAQAIAAVSTKLNDTLGIVIIGVISSVVRSICASCAFYFMTGSFRDRLRSVDIGLYTGERTGHAILRSGIDPSTSRFETYAWIPNLIAFPLLLGLGGKHLNPATFVAVPTPTAASILSFASFVVSSVVSWCTFTPDYGVYHDATASE